MISNGSFKAIDAAAVVPNPRTTVKVFTPSNAVTNICSFVS